MAKRGQLSVEALRADLHAAGLRATPARMAVLEAVRRAQGPRSHGEIADALESSVWDKATVYRNLVALAEAGLVHRTDLGDHTWRFEAPRNASEVDHTHPHFLCVDCGEVTCLSGVAVKIERGSNMPRSARNQGLEIQFRGLCDRCDD